MRTKRELLELPVQNENAAVELLTGLCAALRHLQAAQSKLIDALRPTHDRRLVSEAMQFSDACADEIEALHEELEGPRLARAA